MNIINGQRLANSIKNQLAAEIRKNEKRPGLAIILVGKNEGSEVYVRLKKKAAEYIGMNFHLYRFPEESAVEDIEQTIDWLNTDDDIDGIIIQLPLPDHFDENVLVSRIDPRKDADGFHPDNIKRYLAHESGAKAPVLVEGILALIHQARADISGTQAAILANSSIFALPLSESLEQEDAHVETLLQPTQKDLQSLADKDIVVVAIGKQYFVSAKYSKSDAILIDVGYNRDNGAPAGDIQMDSFHDTDVSLTPVPGGVGPMTVSILLKRTKELYEEHHKKL